MSPISLKERAELTHGSNAAWRRATIAPFVVMVLSLACSPNRVPQSHVVNAHGLAVGDSIEPLALTCREGGDRRIAAPNEVQLITLSTAGDCSACLTHLAGLEQLLVTKQVTAPQFYVSWATTAQIPSAMIAYRATTIRPVCFDTSGTLWDSHNVSHTPVTVVIRNGRVLYMHDMPLISASSQRQFLGDLQDMGVH
jgi:hypothetical protein